MSGRNEKSAPPFGATVRCAPALAVGVALAAMALVSAAGKPVARLP